MNKLKTSIRFSEHVGKMRRLDAGNYTVGRAKPFVEPWHVPLLCEVFFCDGCALHYPIGSARDDSLGIWSCGSGIACDPPCLGCGEEAETHTNGKCLFGPGRYEMAKYLVVRGHM